jgi:hypothetical protein
MQFAAAGSRIDMLDIAQQERPAAVLPQPARRLLDYHSTARSALRLSVNFAVRSESQSMCLQSTGDMDYTVPVVDRRAPGVIWGEGVLVAPLNTAGTVEIGAVAGFVVWLVGDQSFVAMPGYSGLAGGRDVPWHPIAKAGA